MINIKNKSCKKEFCYTNPSFNYEENPPLYCSKHKLENMTNVKNKSCKIENCYTLAGFNYEGKKPLYCLEHKKNDMINLVNKRCKGVLCEVQANPKYDNYCTHCFSNLFPNDPRTPLIRKNSKEIKVVSFITNKRKGWFHDKPLYYNLKGGCCDTRRRIDLRKLINETLLCIEIDENQHKSYKKEDEKNRYNDLFMDYGGKFIFIRYNPDKYKSGNKNKNPNFITRMNSLEKEIEKQTQRILNENNKELVEIIKLFFDN